MTERKRVDRGGRPESVAEASGDLEETILAGLPLIVLIDGPGWMASRAVVFALEWLGVELVPPCENGPEIVAVGDADRNA